MGVSAGVTVRLVRPLLLSLVFGLLGLGAALLFGKPTDLRDIFSLSSRALLVSALLLCTSFLSGGMRILLLARTLHYRLRLLSAVRCHILGAFSAAVTPSGSGNAPAIALMLRRDALAPAHAWSVALYTSVIDLLFYAWFAPASLLTLYLSRRLPGGSWLLLGGVLASALFFGLWYLLVFHFSVVSTLVSRVFRWRPLGRFSARADRFVMGLTTTVARLSATTWFQHILLQLLSIGVHISVFGIFVVVAADLGLSLPILPTLATLFLVFVASHVVPTPGGSGVYELSLPLVLSPGNPSAVVPAVIVWRLLAFYSSFLLGPTLGGVALAKRLGPAETAAPEAAAPGTATLEPNPQKTAQETAVRPGKRK